MCTTWEDHALVHTIIDVGGSVDSRTHEPVKATIESRIALHVSDDGLLVVEMTRTVSFDHDVDVPPSLRTPLKVTTTYRRAKAGRTTSTTAPADNRELQ